MEAIRDYIFANPEKVEQFMIWFVCICVPIVFIMFILTIIQTNRSVKRRKEAKLTRDDSFGDKNKHRYVIVNIPQNSYLTGSHNKEVVVKVNIEVYDAETNHPIAIVDDNTSGKWSGGPIRLEYPVKEKF